MTTEEAMSRAPNWPAEERLIAALKEAQEEIVELKAEVERLDANREWRDCEDKPKHFDDVLAINCVNDMHIDWIEKDTGDWANGRGVMWRERPVGPKGAKNGN